MDDRHPDTSVETAPRSGAAPRRRPVTTQEAREQALQDAILTEAGFAQGYVVLKPGRWLWRFWLELERFNDALQRVETQTFTLLGNRQVDFTLHIQAFQAVLDDYRVTTRRLTQHAHALASGRVKDLEHLTQQALGAWREDPSPPRCRPSTRASPLTSPQRPTRRWPTSRAPRRTLPPCTGRRWRRSAAREPR